MLLRSSSTPILNSWLSHSKESQPEPEPVLSLPRTRSANLSSLHAPTFDPTKKATQFLVESDLKTSPVKPLKKHQIPQINRKQSKNRTKEGTEQQEELKPITILSSSSTRRLFSSSGLGEKLLHDEACSAGKKKESGLQTLVGGGVGNNGGKICGGGEGRKGSDGGDDSGFSEGNNDHGINNTDVYYQQMIQADPSNPLLLSNYAKFLKEVRGDYNKAEEYCERAILANPSDATVLSTYADIIWNTQKDAERAETYFDQAVKASPDDSYVLASYARFLWDAEEDEEEDDEGSERVQHGTDQSHRSSSNFYHGAHHHSPLTAAS